jgi:predicted nucleic-acid-binding protein
MPPTQNAHPDPDDRPRYECVVRYLTHDDPAAQTAAAAVKMMDSLSTDSPGYLSLTVMAELVWLLEAVYRFKKKEIGQFWRPCCEAKNS